MPRFSTLSLMLVVALATLGACTVHHHHPDQAQAYAQQQQGHGAYDGAYAGAYAQPTGAPGQVIAPQDPYSRHDQYDYQQQRPGAPYVAPRSERRQNCTCDHPHDHVPAAVAPRRAIPRGPVTPAELQSNPADWLE